MSLIDELNKQHADISPDSTSMILAPEPGMEMRMPAIDIERDYELQHALVSGDGIRLPLLGTRTAGAHTRMLFASLVVLVLVLIALAVYAFMSNTTARKQVSAAGEVLLQAERVSRSAGLALIGQSNAFQDLKNSQVALESAVTGLSRGNESIPVVTDAALRPDVEVVDKNGETLREPTKTILLQEAPLSALGKSLNDLHASASALDEQADTLKNALVQRNASSSEIGAAAEVQVTVQRVERAANEFMTPAGISPEGVFTLGKDISTLEEILAGFDSGSEDIGLKPLQGGEKEILANLHSSFTPLQARVNEILKSMQGVVSARQAQVQIDSAIATLLPSAKKVQEGLLGSAGVHWLVYPLMALAGLLAIVCAAGLAYVQVADVTRRQKKAEEENNNNQTAILRLMNELQNVAEGDLTQEATVTEDITGSIADSVNVTVEELRALVGNVQATADQVATTTTSVEQTSNALLDASTEQLHEIRNTGQSVLDMAGRINSVSAQAQESATVAQKSRQAAEQGSLAVQDTINGMNVIRDQIQETSKRIKRLGESSQEIGEITELISDITEQTNVLALNAAIQAASAGEAGRGFSVVAEEVQRLAERSGEATRQIAALVKTIQADTHDAIAAMERSTQGVVQGAQLSDNAGKALTEIDRVSNQLSDLITEISQTTGKEAQSANDLAANIQQIFLVTEQTGEGTRTTAQQVRELAKVAQDLRTSVSRFKIS